MQPIAQRVQLDPDSPIEAHEGIFLPRRSFRILYMWMGWVSMFVAGISAAALVFSSPNPMSWMRWAVLAAIPALILGVMGRWSEMAVRISGVISGFCLGSLLYLYVTWQPLALGVATVALAFGAFALWELRFGVGRWTKITRKSVFVPPDLKSPKWRSLDWQALAWRMVFFASGSFLAWSFMWVSVSNKSEAIRYVHKLPYADAIELCVAAVVLGLLGRKIKRRFPRFFKWVVTLYGGTLGVTLSYFYFRQFDTSLDNGVRLAWLVVGPVVLIALVMWGTMSCRLKSVIDAEMPSIAHLVSARKR